MQIKSRLMRLLLVLAVGTSGLNAGSSFASSTSAWDDHFRKEHFQFDPVDESKAVNPAEGYQAPMTQVMRLQEKLLFLAEYYGKMDYVPYIWGGGNIGTKEACLECRQCALKKGTGLKSRLGRCRSCQSCGIDCSHFVNMVYNEAGLDYPYASTAELRRGRPEEMASNYRMLDMGKDLRVVQPGDLLVYKNHVVMAVALRGGGRGDFVHSTRFGDRRQTGGIKLERDRLLTTYRGKLVRILRHRKFFEAHSPLLTEEGAKLLQRPDITSPFAARFLGPMGPVKGFIER